VVSFEFLLTSFIVVLAPGTGVVFTVSTGITQGRAASIYAALGCTLGVIPHLLATVLGLAALLHTSALAFSILKYLGATYLLYIAYSTWRDTSAFLIDESAGHVKPLGLIVKAFLMNILNPKLTIFFLAFLPQFVRPLDYSPMVQLLVLSAVFMLMTFLVFAAYGFLAHAFRRRIVESKRAQRALRYGFSFVFAGMGARLANSAE
jgi:threonine/homoserine/homoserine lactone efflux protein